MWRCSASVSEMRVPVLAVLLLGVCTRAIGGAVLAWCEASVVRVGRSTASCAGHVARAAACAVAVLYRTVGANPVLLASGRVSGLYTDHIRVRTASAPLAGFRSSASAASHRQYKLCGVKSLKRLVVT